MKRDHPRVVHLRNKHAEAVHSVVLKGAVSIHIVATGPRAHQSYGLAGDSEGDTFDGKFHFRGSDYNDIMILSAGDVVIRGGLGDDTLTITGTLERRLRR